MDIAGSREEQLILAYQAGDRKAGELLLEAHRGLIHQFARKYSWTDQPPEDREQDAKIGFLEGVRRWDPTKKAKLATYARWWIRQELQASWRNGGATIRLPVHQHERRMTAKKHGCSVVEAVRRGILEAGVADPETDAWTSSVASLDVPAGDDGFTTVGDLLPSGVLPADEEYEQRLRRDRMYEAVEVAVERLPEREQRVVGRRYFGVGASGEDEDRTLDEIGQDRDFAVSRERIRQIEDDALRSLRSMIRVVDGMAMIDPEVAKRPPTTVVDVARIPQYKEWSRRIADWIRGQAFVPTFEILRDALNVPEEIQTDGHRRAIHALMTPMGWVESSRILRDGRQASGYTAPPHLHPQQQLFRC